MCQVLHLNNENAEPVVFKVRLAGTPRIIDRILTTDPGIGQNHRTETVCTDFLPRRGCKMASNYSIATVFDRTPAALSLEKVSRSRVRRPLAHATVSLRGIFADNYSVLLQAMKDEPAADAKCKDKFLVQTVAVTREMEFSNVTSIVRQSPERNVSRTRAAP